MLTRADIAKQAVSIPSETDIRTLVIRTTSGTSGGVPVVRVRRAAEFDRRPSLVTLKQVLIAVGPLNQRLNHLVSALYQESGVERICAIDRTDLDATGAVLAEYRPDFILGTVPFLAALVERAPDSSMWKDVSLVNIAGGLVMHQAGEFLCRTFRNARFQAVYAASEIGRIGISVCGFLGWNRYHPYEEVRVEVIGADAEGLGDLVVSKSSNGIERYRIGDAGRMANEICPCGNPVTFEVCGRTDFDFVKVAGAVVRQEEFDRVMKLLVLLVQDYRVTVSELFSGDTLVGTISIDIVPTAMLRTMRNAEQTIAAKIAELLYVTPTQTLSQLIAEGHFTPLSVVWAADLPFLEKNTKLRRRR